MRIYVAGPIRSATPEGVNTNVENAMRVGLELLKKGHAPFIPHLNHPMDLFVKTVYPPNMHLDYEDYMLWDDEFLITCQGFFYISPSPGADRELARAKKIGLRIFSSLKDVPINEVGLHKKTMSQTGQKAA